MSEATPQKRVLPARERADSSAKRRPSSPATPATPVSEPPRQKRKYTKRASLSKAPTPARAVSESSTPAEEALPSKVQDSKPLPTASQKQPDVLSNNEYQSIAESAVLAASLHRSRMQWLCNGIFTRYWSKPVKRKGVIEQPQGNPDVKSMSKLGNATMTIEPHVFEVTFYTVKDPSIVQPPYHRLPNQHTPKQPTISQPSPQPPTHSSPTPQVAKPTVTPPVASASVKQETSSPQVKLETPGQTTSMTPIPVHAPARPVAHPPVRSVAPSSSTAPRTATDPVIRMLAARAATDNRLKELMKVVAMSQASHEQLREFQAHIDEFNKIIKQQESKSTAENEKPKQAPAAAATHPATYNAPSRPHPGPPASMGGPMHMAPPSFPAYPAPRPEPFIKHIVVEFHSTEASTDRWLFPEYAVLDIKSGGMEMVASFFVVRKGEDISKRQGGEDEADVALHQKFTREMEYYEPVTVLVKATQHRTIETIARAAKPLVECEKYMKEVMEKKTRAPREYLVQRLPRERMLTEVGAAEFVDSAVEMSNDEDDELKDVYGTM